MDESEKLAEVFLVHSGFKNIVFEPDGNVPPDFLVDGEIAVEVRRLNQNHDDGQGKGARGLEEDAIPLWHRVRKYLRSLGPPKHGCNSWFIFYRFTRPIPRWRDVERELDNVLKPFMTAQSPKSFKKSLLTGFEIRVAPAAKSHESFFVLGGHSDDQSGGWLLHEMSENLALCISEKTDKISRYCSKYPTWWLVMPDHIGYSLDNFERGLFADQVTFSNGGFDRIVLLDPRDATRSYTVYP